MESEQDTNTAQAEENLSSNNMPQISSKTDDSSMPKKSMKKRK